MTDMDKVTIYTTIRKTGYTHVMTVTQLIKLGFKTGKMYKVTVEKINGADEDD